MPAKSPQTKWRVPGPWLRLLRELAALDRDSAGALIDVGAKRLQRMEDEDLAARPDREQWLRYCRRLAPHLPHPIGARVLDQMDNRPEELCEAPVLLPHRSLLHPLSGRLLAVAAGIGDERAAQLTRTTLHRWKAHRDALPLATWVRLALTLLPFMRDSEYPAQVVDNLIRVGALEETVYDEYDFATTYPCTNCGESKAHPRSAARQHLACFACGADQDRRPLLAVQLAIKRMQDINAAE